MVAGPELLAASKTEVASAVFAALERIGAR
jgi:hypothetical protein